MRCTPVVTSPKPLQPKTDQKYAVAHGEKGVKHKTPSAEPGRLSTPAHAFRNHGKKGHEVVRAPKRSRAVWLGVHAAY
jgi:hypothetical protein